jgi:hypothetical protein
LFARHPEERSEEERFSIARLSRDESLFVRQFQQHRCNPPSLLGGLSFRACVSTSGSSFVCRRIPSFALRCHPEERSDEVRFSIARVSRDESLFMRQFEQHHSDPQVF